MFKTDFDHYALEGETITCEVDGFIVTARIERDDDHGAPDKEQDGFWSSLDPKDAGYIGNKSKRTLQRRLAHEREVLRAWKNDEWFWCGICLTVQRNGITLTHEYSNALWGIECNYPSRRKGNRNAYLREVANELLEGALEEAREAIIALNPAVHVLTA